MSEAKGSQKKEKYMSFLEHLEELRRRLLHSVGAVVLCSIVAGIFHKQIFFALTRSVPDLYWHTPLEPYFTFLKLAVVVGIFASFPYILYQMWRFVSPGLYAKEKKYLLPFIGSAWILFVSGAVFVYLIMLPFISSYLYGFGLIRLSEPLPTIEERWERVADAVVLLADPVQDATAIMDRENIKQQIEGDLNRMRAAKNSQTEVGNVWSVGRYINLALMLFLAFGVAFDLPVVIVTLALMGVVKPKTMAKARPVVVVLIFLVAAILTPPDPASQIMMGLPMYFLFEISLAVAAVLLRLKKGRDKKPPDRS